MSRLFVRSSTCPSFRDTSFRTSVFPCSRRVCFRTSVFPFFRFSVPACIRRAFLGGALVQPFGAAVGETATGLGLGGGGNHAGDGVQPVADVGRGGDGLQQPPGVRVLRVVENLVARAVLGDFAGVHDADLVGHLVDDPQIMRDEQDGHAGLALEIFHQGQNLGLDGDVQGGGRLVGDE